MAYNDRQQQNLAQRAQNEVLDKTLKRGESLLHPADRTLVSNVNFKTRTPFLFLPQIARFEGLSNSAGTGNILEKIQQFLNVLQQFPLALDVPPSTVQYNYTKKKSERRTNAGWVEWHWGEQLDEISANGSTGAFINSETGLAEGPDRRASFSYVNYENLLRLYKNNGAIYDAFGKVMVFSGLFLVNDIGVFSGFFDQMSVRESGDQPYRFSLNWSFKVKSVIHFFTNLT